MKAIGICRDSDDKIVMFKNEVKSWRELNKQSSSYSAKGGLGSISRAISSFLILPGKTCTPTPRLELEKASKHHWISFPHKRSLE